MGGIPFIVSAPSGAGKTTLCKKAVDFFPDLRHSISYTTRLPRAGEVNGVDYWFIEDRVFDEMIARGEFLEYAGVYGKRYGTSKKDLDHLLSEGLSVILEIDIQGADQIREKIPGAVGVFILPPSIEACRVRLRQRGKDSTEEIEKRLNIALEEVKRAPLYDYIIINDDLEAAFERFKSVVAAEKARTPRMLEAVSGIFGAATEK
ncbi:MAG: guanylate kinase [Deltaproteobacteria bacterium GWC2_56_8]|nr:MAG: guanylate kinase [Deltaproteobacteria bacterium GWB2_55_19]OGP34557.1 MAG: guanylate kinase [Deltaproteobacteria bacterium GWC2_56_8]HAO93753.1 guanylate kinase [Deltaproteobacteria bacterium]